MTLLRVLCVLLGYLAGSIPFAYLAGRLIRGVDIRQYGSRAVTGSNVYENVSRPAVVVVGLLDMGKAALPTWLGLRWGLGLPTGLAAGLAAVVGHNTKRIEANRQPLPEGRERWRTLRRRLLLDRDMDDWETWAHRRPDQSPSEEK